MNIFSTITARTMMKNKTRTIVTIIGVILSTAMITAVTTFAVSMQKFLIDYSISRDGNWHVQAGSVENERVLELTGKEEVKEATIVKEIGYAPFAPVQDNSPAMPYLYVQALSEAALEKLPMLISEGRLPENENEVAIPSYLQFNEDEEERTLIGDVLTLEIGDRMIDGERLNQNNPYIGLEEDEEQETFLARTTKSYTVVGVYDSWVNVSYGGAGYDVLAGPTQEETVYQDIYFEMKNPKEVYAFAENYIAGGAESCIFNQGLLRWLGVADNDNFGTVLTSLLTILIIVIMAGSITLIYNAFSISVRERSSQFGLLSSIGATKKQLKGSMRYEAFFVSIIGIPIGIISGIGGIGVTLHFIGKYITKFIHGTDMGIALTVSVGSVFAAAVIAMITIMISVWLPSRRIKKISPMEAIRATSDIKIRPKEVKTGKWVMKLFGLSGMLAEKNYKRDRKKYRATVVSLTMSIVLFTTASLFNMYLMKTGAFVLEAPDVELEYALYEDAVEENDETIEKILKKADGVTEIYKYGYLYSTLFIPDEWADGGYLKLMGDTIAKTDGKTPLNFKMFILEDNEFESYAKEQGVKIKEYEGNGELNFLYVNMVGVYNPDTQRYEKQKILSKGEGEKIAFGEVHYEDEQPWFESKGEARLYAEAKALPEELSLYDAQGAIVISKSMYKRFEETMSEYGLSTKYQIQCEDADKTCENIEEELERKGLGGAGSMANFAQDYEEDRNTMAAVNVLTYGFIVLISLIAIANVFNTISTNLMLRRKEFAMLRSMGMSPKEFKKMMNFECLIYGMRAIFYGVVFTILISFAIRYSIGAGADVDFIIPWMYLGIAVAGVFAVVFVTMLYTMHKIKKNNIVDELKMN